MTEVILVAVMGLFGWQNPRDEALAVSLRKEAQEAQGKMMLRSQSVCKALALATSSAANVSSSCKLHAAEAGSAQTGGHWTPRVNGVVGCPCTHPQEANLMHPRARQSRVRPLTRAAALLFSGYVQSLFFPT